MENLQQFLMPLLILGALYFLMIRPQLTKQKKEKQFQDNLKPGRRVVTSGIHGRIFSIAEDGVVIETLSGKLRMELAAISKDLTLSRFPEEGEEKK